jgi:hypothetical protein
MEKNEVAGCWGAGVPGRQGSGALGRWRSACRPASIALPAGAPQQVGGWLVGARRRRRVHPKCIELDTYVHTQGYRDGTDTGNESAGHGTPVAFPSSARAPTTRVRMGERHTFCLFPLVPRAGKADIRSPRSHVSQLGGVVPSDGAR